MERKIFHEPANKLVKLNCWKLFVRSLRLALPIIHNWQHCVQSRLQLTRRAGLPPLRTMKGGVVGGVSVGDDGKPNPWFPALALICWTGGSFWRHRGDIYRRRWRWCRLYSARIIGVWIGYDNVWIRIMSRIY